MNLKKRTESNLQENIVTWLKGQYPDILMTICPITKVSKAQGAKLKRMGYEPGTHDLLILEPRKGYYGLCVEIKMPNGKVSPAQIKFGERAEDRGYKAIICPTNFKTENECYCWVIGNISAYMSEDRGQRCKQMTRV